MMPTKQISPKIQPIIETVLALSPQEQFQVIMVLLQTVFGIQKDDDRLTEQSASKIAPKAGSAKGLVTIAEDFDEPLTDFKEYM